MLKVLLLFIVFIYMLFSSMVFSGNNVDYWHLPVAPQGNLPDWLPAEVFKLDADRCGLCHVTQYKDWKTSLHANSFKEGLAGQLPLFDEDTQADCLNCHLPRTEQQIRWKQGQVGDLDNQHGVDCASCHLRNQTRHGPRDIAITPHGSVLGKDLFKQSEFCSSCHQFDESALLVNGKPLENTYQEWKSSRYAKRNVTCQDCHMPKQSHTFKGVKDVDMVRSALSIMAKRKSNSLLELTLENIGAGHALPTYITPRIRVEWISEQGKTKRLASIQRKMNWTEMSGWSEIYDTRLLPDEPRQIIVQLDSGEAGDIEVWVDPDADYYERVYPVILEALKETEAAEKSIQQLQVAMDRAGNSGYLLLRLHCDAGENLVCR